MPSRELIMLTIEKIYEAAAKDDKETLSLYHAPDATYRMAAENIFGSIVPPGPSNLVETGGELIDLIIARGAEILEAVVEGNKAAVYMKADISIRGRDEQVTTEFMELWEFDEDGQVQSLVQFMDTALIKKMLVA